uniref:Uncharacterized protein n=1 Tax=Romanomermis culicivorax TaxID=13658 RepID=A0A915IGY1_ROMCU
MDNRLKSLELMLMLNIGCPDIPEPGYKNKTLPGADPELYWSCRARGSMMIISRRAHFSCIKKEIDFKFTFFSASSGYHNFIDFEELIDPENGLICNDNVIFQVWITVSEIEM